jgi:hypothetical protein
VRGREGTPREPRRDEARVALARLSHRACGAYKQIPPATRPRGGRTTSIFRTPCPEREIVVQAKERRGVDLDPVSDEERRRHGRRDPLRTARSGEKCGPGAFVRLRSRTGAARPGSGTGCGAARDRRTRSRPHGVGPWLTSAAPPRERGPGEPAIGRRRGATTRRETHRARPEGLSASAREGIAAPNRAALAPGPTTRPRGVSSQPLRASGGRRPAGRPAPRRAPPRPPGSNAATPPPPARPATAPDPSSLGRPGPAPPLPHPPRIRPLSRPPSGAAARRAHSTPPARHAPPLAGPSPPPSSAPRVARRPPPPHAPAPSAHPAHPAGPRAGGGVPARTVSR